MTYLSVIIPAYNEEAVIEGNINEVAEYLYRQLDSEKRFEIIVVNDGSSDNTGEVVDRLADERQYLIALHHKKNLGRGRALRTGFQKAAGKFIITIDADLSYVPEHIGRLLVPLETGETDVVLASAFHDRGQISNVPMGRKLTSKLGNKLLSLSLGGNLKTVTCVVRGYTKEVIDSLILFSDDKDIHLEIIQKARMLGFKIMEVPAELKWRATNRTSDKKGLSFGAFWKMATKHLFFNFLFRPSMLSWFPIVIIALIFVVVTITIVIGYQSMLDQQEAEIGILRFYFALRDHILFAKASYFVWSLCLLLLFQFSSLVFIAKQNNHYYREFYALFVHLLNRLRDPEDKT
jgi:glycosyltransferase involved in cell wall biosynthesis